MTASPQDALARRFERFARLECHGSSPLYERLSLGIAADPDLLALAARARAGQPTPNLFVGAVHALLLGGVQHPLARFYPSLTPDPDREGDPYPSFRNFCLDHAEQIRALIATRLVQTNEVRRCALLLPAFAVVAQRTEDRPPAVVEVGASAGLNLLWDRYTYDYGDGAVAGDPFSPVRITCAVRGPHRPPVPVVMPRVVARIGIDLNPIDVRDADAVAWLRALIWPEHSERATLLAQAIAMVQAEPPSLIAGDALAVLPGVLDGVPEDAALCVVHTHTLNQFSSEAWERFTALIDAYGARRDLYRISIADLFGEGDDPLLGLVTYENGVKQEQVLAACDAHGRWIAWRG
ncbi:MAG: DUF2332 domain-containing protein [Dehalococcoidia bacterium]